MCRGRNLRWFLSFPPSLLLLNLSLHPHCLPQSRPPLLHLSFTLFLCVSSCSLICLMFSSSYTSPLCFFLYCTSPICPIIHLSLHVILTFLPAFHLIPSFCLHLYVSTPPSLSLQFPIHSPGMSLCYCAFFFSPLSRLLLHHPHFIRSHRGTAVGDRPAEITVLLLH